MGIRSTLQLPKEHGSWGMFAIPLVLGAIAGGTFTRWTVLLIVSAAAAFLAREPFMGWWRAWRRRVDPQPARTMAAIYMATSVAAGIFLLPRFPWLAALGVTGAAVFSWSAELAMRGEGRNLLPELLAIATSMLLAPAAYYVGTGRLDRTALLLWAVCFAYFGSSVFYVKMRVAASRPRRPDAPAVTRRNCLLYHSALLAGIPWLPHVLALGFVPILGRAFYYVIRPSTNLNLKQIGWTEVAYSIWFVALAGVALR